MPYKRKNYRGKARRSRRPTAAKNLGKIEHIQRSLKSEIQRTVLQHQVTNNALTDYVVHPIVPCLATGSTVAPAWGDGYFSQSEIGALASTATCGRIYLDFAFSAYSEKQPVTFTVMHVKLQPAQADFVIQSQTLQLSSLNTASYSMRGVSVVNAGIASLYGTAHVNPMYFKEVKRWDFTLGPTQSTSATSPASTTVLSNTHKAWQYSFPTGYKMGTPGLDAWQGILPEDICKNENVNFILIFSDNLTGLDLGNPSYTINARTTVSSRT